MVFSSVAITTRPGLRTSLLRLMRRFSMTDKEPSDQYDEAEAERRYKTTLTRILAAPPDHKVKPNANPKKRGRPPKTTIADPSP
jgi:hypothetical protein